MSEKPTNNIFYLVLPLVAVRGWSTPQRQVVDDYVARYGYDVFDPELVSSELQPALGLVERAPAARVVPTCAALVYALYRLTRLEDAQARAWQRAKVTSSSSSSSRRRVPAGSEANRELLHEAEALTASWQGDCDRSRITEAQLLSLVRDLYSEQDRPVFPELVRTSAPSRTARAREEENDEDEYLTGQLLAARQQRPQWVETPNEERQNRSAVIVLRPSETHTVETAGGLETKTDRAGAMRLRYVGHVYVWPDEVLPDTLAMIGIRSSLENLACRNVTHVLWRILQAVAEQAWQMGLRYVHIEAPLEHVAALLERLPAAARPHWLAERHGRFSRTPRGFPLDPLLSVAALRSSLREALHGAVPRSADDHRCWLAGPIDRATLLWDVGMTQRERAADAARLVEAARREALEGGTTSACAAERAAIGVASAERFLRRQLERSPLVWHTPSARYYCKNLADERIVPAVFAAPRFAPTQYLILPRQS